MKENVSIWSKEELQAYLFIYCAHADFVEKKEEKDMILSNVDRTTFNKIHQEFDEDTDYQRIQKILAATENYYKSRAQKDKLIEEIMALFLSDGKFDTLEKNLLRELKRLIR